DIRPHLFSALPIPASRPSWKVPTPGGSGTGGIRNPPPGVDEDTGQDTSHCDTTGHLCLACGRTRPDASRFFGFLLPPIRAPGAGPHPAARDAVPALVWPPVPGRVSPAGAGPSPAGQNRAVAGRTTADASSAGTGLPARPG